MLGVFDNTMNENYEYFRNNRANLHLPIEINLSEKPSKFCGTFFPFLGSKLKLPYCAKKKEPS